MKKIMKTMLLTGLIIFTACGENKTSETAKDGELGGSLVIYNTTPEWLVDKVVEAFNELHPHVEIHAPKTGTETIVNKLLLEDEQDMVSGDLVWVADSASLEMLIDNNILAHHESVETAAIEDSYKDPHGYWFGNRVLKMALAYNANIEEAPTSWSDLIDEKNRGKIALPGISGGSIYTWAATMVYNEDEFGWNYMDDFKNNDGFLVRNLSTLAGQISTGEVQMGVVTDYIVRDLQDQGSPIEYIYPKEGAVEFATPIALLEGANNPEAAKAFLDFTLSEEGQRIFAENNQSPARKLDLDIDYLAIEHSVLEASTDFLQENQTSVRNKLAEIFGVMN